MLCASNMLGVVVSAILLSTVIDVQSRHVQHPQRDRSVVHKKIIATWDETQRRCEAEGAVMTSTLDAETLEYARSSIGINNHTTPHFVGFRVIGNPELIYASMGGVPLDNLPEDVINMIEQLDPEDNVCLGMSHHNIRVVSCRARLPYICYRSDMTTSTTVTPVDVTTGSKAEVTTINNENCTKGYTNLSGSYYKLHNDVKPESWDDAQRICAAEGAYLAVINDENEAQTVKDFISTDSEDFYDWVFIGVRNREGNGNWQSVLGHPMDQIYHTWSSMHTNSYQCGAIDMDGYLDDIDCSTSYACICEKQC